ARLRTEPARAEVDRRPGARTRADTGVAARLDAALRGLRLAGARLPARAVRACAARRRPRVEARGDGARGAVPRAARPSSAGDDLRARTPDLPVVGGEVGRIGSDRVGSGRIGSDGVRAPLADSCVR